MSQDRTAESIEAESARIRAQLVAVGADLRAHADTSVVVDAAKASFARRSKDVPQFLQKNASPIMLVLVGGALGATLTGLFASPKLRAGRSTLREGESGSTRSPSAKTQLEAALLSTASVALGYLGGMFIPKTPLEDKYLGPPKAAARARFDAFLDQHMQGMKLAVANLFGVSRLAATTLIGLAAVAEALGITKRSSRRNAL